MAPHDTISVLEKIIDEVICLLIPHEFHSVGFYYNDFKQTTDDEIFSLICELNKR